MNAVARPVLLALLLGLAFVLSQKLLYEPFVVPRLSAWEAVPFLWWLAVFTPEFAVCTWAALYVRNIKEGALFCVLGGLVVTTVQWVDGALHQPGNAKAIEGSILHFALQMLIVTVLLFCAVGLVGLIRLGFRGRASVS